MMRATLLLLVALPAAPRGDVDAAKRALLDCLAVSNKNEATEANLKTLSACDDEDVAGALGGCYEKGCDLLRAAHKDVAKWAKEMEDSKVVYDQYGRYVKGKADVFAKAEEAWNAARGRVGFLDYWTPRIAGAIVDLKSDRQIAGALKTFKANGDFYVRGCAALALGRANSKEAVEALVAALKAERESSIRVALLDALAPRAKDDPVVRDLVIEAIKANDWQVQIAALQAFRLAPNKAAATHLIGALKGATGRIKNELNETLKAVTGVDKHGDVEAWKTWWDEHGDEFLAGTYVPHPSERADNKGNSTFYGLPVHSTRLVFLLDTSGSMQEKPNWLPPDFNGKGEASRLEVAKFELRKIITLLPGNAEFNVVLFHSWLEPYADKMKTMTGGERTKCLKWVEAIKHGDGTHTWEGLEEVYRQAGGNFWAKNASGTLDTIYLMTDGVPSSGVTDLKQFIDKITAINRFKKIAIHTIGVDPPANGEELLKQIAAATGGMYIRR
jgi:HEAT repeat protein